MKQKKPIILIAVLVVMLLLEIAYYLQNNVLPAASHKVSSGAEIKDELIISFFRDNIESDSSKYYDNYFSSQLEYYNYEMKVLDVKKDYPEAGTIYITFGNTPMIGAHNPVGYDELVYKVDVFGNKTLEKFTHLKSFEVPERFRTDMIKPYPETE